MSKILEIIKRDRLYVLLLAFIICINVLGAMMLYMSKQGYMVLPEEVELRSQESNKETIRLDHNDIKKREQKIKSLIKENPLLFIFFGLLNLFLLFLLGLGFFLNIYFIIQWRKKISLNLSINKLAPPKWPISDIFRVVLIFITASFFVLIFQSALAKIFPVVGNKNFQMVFNTVVTNIIVIGVILHFLKYKYGHSLEEIGITLKKPLISFFYGIVGYISILPVLALVMGVTFLITQAIKYEPPVQPIVQIFIEEKNTAVLMFSALFASIFGPIAEEVLFRGFIYPAIKKKTGTFWAMMITSFVFSILHAHIVGILPIMVLGLLLVYLYEKTGSLLPSVIVHVIHNLSAFIMVLIIRGIGV